MRATMTAIALAVVLATAGCGGDSSSDGTAAVTTAPGTPTTAPAATTTAPSGAVTTTAPAGTPVFEDDLLAGKSDTEHYDYEFTGPRLKKLSDLAIQDKVNVEIRTELDAVATQFLAAIKERTGQPPVGTEESTLTGDYTVSRLDAGLASFRVDMETYIAGAAHPFDTVLALTFDLRTGTRLALADLFTPGSPYLDKLSEQSRELLTAQVGADAFPQAIELGTEPKAENFVAWTVTDDALEITFPQGQAGPSAAGTLRVSIPFASLRTLLDPAGPLAIHN